MEKEKICGVLPLMLFCGSSGMKGIAGYLQISLVLLILFGLLFSIRPLGG